MINIKYEEQQRHTTEKDRGDISCFTITLFAIHSLRINSRILQSANWERTGFYLTIHN